MGIGIREGKAHANTRHSIARLLVASSHPWVAHSLFDVSTLDFLNIYEERQRREDEREGSGSLLMGPLRCVDAWMRGCVDACVSVVP